MLLRKRYRTKLILVIVAVLLFLYWRGIKNVEADKKWDCEYHIAYAVCDTKGAKSIPGIFEVLKAGARF
ncbi:MAG: hypothetical protein A3I07_03075 [Candidatus Doudnabacteria bacterium RIFCSPLOWO2_02_FULL_42_9]|uniref:Uncharacterized protein n=1 Tax=Candidatus Doudnabacteria bacterium RIFCSPHIGHO2_01_FULL_41_86 TaxID=1817821 RepID=A0A1F5N940_9BACT|nr:MAG: hypothetical protein A2717_01535 [Candidatus Doudnabacteria bacterium RIFCSPHIGHO2_01_FULL_41_86]OGE75043.1 MAG: hypothetical protein A3K07_04715 [Candidatus Doudnabacteria bacterium RIFCSPHIGHO2_01_43_10]OGE85250.1 MAG: hypothetical protein A3E28_01105 [Candidatus Doudnabacteria bacterium RIFCSPHIGHO2_12_FULL_42_22]OGE86788.1 MAG: hypothetical protein A3C49_01940 [Candidatus Doudnabacteria bacterium RIFCSPHIGHO2_02_FULL_42_25]OGE92387.1 MAG: hypothetical protein A2895_02095 [Candidatus